MCKFVVTVVTTKMVVLAYFKESCGLHPLPLSKPQPIAKIWLYFGSEEHN